MKRKAKMMRGDASQTRMKRKGVPGDTRFISGQPATPRGENRRGMRKR